MKNKSVSSLTNRETPYIIINLLICRIFTRIPVFFPRIAGTAAALSSLFSGLIVFLLVFLIIRTFSSLPHTNILDAAKNVFGRTGEVIVALTLLFYLAVSAIITLKEISLLVKLISFPTAPMFFVSAFLVLSALAAAFGGIKTVSALHRLFVPFTVFILVITVVSTLWQSDLTRLLPFFGRGADNVFGKGISGIVMYTDIVLLFLISPEEKSAPLTNGNYNAKYGTVTLSVFCGILLVFSVMFAFNTKIPYPISNEGQFPIFLLLKEVFYGRFFQRIDALLLIAALFSGMLYLSLNISLFSESFKKAFKASDALPIIFTVTPALYFTVSGTEFISAQALETLLFCCSFGVWIVFLITVFFTFLKSRRKNVNEKI